ncbi:MAG TPA: peroxiredoxin family protein [Cytophagaceae bacterium]|nr:peroxiredoxin family protein [Cytophagaceae bacterium]
MEKIILLLLFLMIGVSGAFAQDEVFGLKVGDVAPDFSLYDQHENTFKLSKALEKGPVVVFFYRGQWCPFCTKYMKNYQDSLQFIKAKGAQIVGISPQAESAVQKSIEKTGATFPLLSDQNKAVCFKYNTLTKADRTNEEANPVPALYVVGKDGKIKYVHFPNSFTLRANVSDFLPFL